MLNIKLPKPNLETCDNYLITQVGNNRIGGTVPNLDCHSVEDSEHPSQLQATQFPTSPQISFHDVSDTEWRRSDFHKQIIRDNLLLVGSKSGNWEERLCNDTITLYYTCGLTIDKVLMSAVLLLLLLLVVVFILLTTIVIVAIMVMMIINHFLRECVSIYIIYTILYTHVPSRSHETSASPLQKFRSEELPMLPKIAWTKFFLRTNFVFHYYPAVKSADVDAQWYMWTIVNTYGYGSIPIDTFLVGWTSIYQLFWCELQGYKVLTHSHMTMIYGYVKSVKSINCKSKTIKNPWFSTSFCSFRVSPVHRWFTPWWPRLDQQCLLVGGHPNVLLGGQHQELLRRVDGGIGFFWRKGWVGIYIHNIQYI